MITNEKSIIRKLIKDQLFKYKDNFKPESDIIFNKIINSSEYKKANTVLSYMALEDEVDIPITKLLTNTEKNIYIPKVQIKTIQMDFYKYTENTIIENGAYDIKEPLENEDLFPLYNKEKLSEMGNILVIVPGRAFTKEGFRLGRGKGYYDNFLNELIKNYDKNKIIIAGVCFKPQLINKLPTESHDVKMDLIFTAN